MLEFEVAGDRNNFNDLQKIFLEIKCKIVQSSDADLKYDNTAAADVTKTDAPYFCNNVLRSLFSACTVSANGLKISSADGNYAHKSFIETEFSHNKDAKSTWLACQGYSYEANPGELQHPKSPDEKLKSEHLLSVHFTERWRLSSLPVINIFSVVYHSESLFGDQLTIFL